MEQVQCFGEREGGIPSPAPAASLRSLGADFKLPRPNPGACWVTELGLAGLWRFDQWDLGQHGSRRILKLGLQPSLTIQHMDFRVKHGDMTDRFKTNDFSFEWINILNCVV